MSSRRLGQFAVAGATLFATLAPAPPALAAPVTATKVPAAAPAYDPVAKTGFVGRSSVRKAFGWTDTTLAARAAALVFDHEFWTDDTYQVSCGGPDFPVVHHLQYGRYQLADDVRRGSYGGKLIGFRLSGARFGISGTSVAPAAGQPCPEPGRGATVGKSRRVSSASGWSLTVSSGSLRRELLASRADSQH